jgi:hypothetical protein
MNRVLHLSRECIVDHAVASHETFSLKEWRYYRHPIVTTSRGCASVSDMLSAFVFNFHDRRSQGLTKHSRDFFFGTHFFP